MSYQNVNNIWLENELLGIENSRTACQVTELCYSQKYSTTLSDVKAWLIPFINFIRFMGRHKSKIIRDKQTVRPIDYSAISSLLSYIIGILEHSNFVPNCAS